MYDGVPGPKFDQIFPQGMSLTGVIFSPDGNRYAYCGLQGNEVVVMVDGKEMYRDSKTNVQSQINAGSCQLMSFTSSGKHVYFFSQSKYEGATDGFRFVWDGKADTINSNHDLRDFGFSPDGDHVAIGTKAESTQVVVAVHSVGLAIPDKAETIGGTLVLALGEEVNVFAVGGEAHQLAAGGVDATLHIGVGIAVYFLAVNHHDSVIAL